MKALLIITVVVAAIVYMFTAIDSGACNGTDPSPAASCSAPRFGPGDDNPVPDPEPLPRPPVVIHPVM